MTTTVLRYKCDLCATIHPFETLARWCEMQCAESGKVSDDGPVREALGRIRPLAGDGPNFFTVDMGGWTLNAPTKARLGQMVRDWFGGQIGEAA